jgi:hypothetical protein
MLFLGACGTRVAGRDGTTPPTATATGPFPWTTMQPSAVTGARLGEDRRTLSLDARVPSGGHPCVRDLKAVVSDTVPGTVWVQVTFSSPSSDRRAGCNQERVATTRVRLPEPLRDQKLIVDNYTQFTTDGARLPALRLCGRLGCHPPATGCTTASYEQALIAVDAPNHTYRDAEHCDGKWLVLDISWPTGPVCGAAGPGCSSRLGDRWFLRAEHRGWVPIAHGTAGGCRDVHRVEPAFPTSLCASLAPLPAALHPSHPPASPSPSNTARPHARSTATTAP